MIIGLILALTPLMCAQRRDPEPGLARLVLLRAKTAFGAYWGEQGLCVLNKFVRATVTIWSSSEWVLVTALE